MLLLAAAPAKIFPLLVSKQAYRVNGPGSLWSSYGL